MSDGTSNRRKESPTSSMWRIGGRIRTRRPGFIFLSGSRLARDTREARGVLRKDLISKRRLVYDAKASKNNLNDVNPS